MKSPISMRNGTFNTSKCRGKLQKMEVLYTHSPQSPGPFPRLPKKNFKKLNFFEKKRLKKNFKRKKRKKKKDSLALSRYRPAVDGSIPGQG
jgi:hypothetical protein